MNDTLEIIPSASGSTALEPETWVECHGDYLFNYAVGQLRDASAAEDLVQDTLLAAMRSHGRFAGLSTERTWLIGILRHKILDYRRLAERRPTVPLTTTGSRTGDGLSDETMLWVHEVADGCASPSRRLELVEFREALVAALGSLPPRISQVFELYEIQDLPSGEVCAEMAINPNNLWVMLYRARQQLRECLGESWKDAATETMPFNA